MIKPSEIKHGKTFYEVMAFPGEKKAWIDTIRVTGRPKVSVYVDSLFYPNVRYYDWGMYNDTSSLKDRNIPENRYNFHRLFRTMKEALRYKARMESGCLNAQELKKLRGDRRIGVMGDPWGFDF